MRALVDWVPELNFAGGVAVILSVGAAVGHWVTTRWGR